MRHSRVTRNILVLPQKRIQIISVNNQAFPSVGADINIIGENFGANTGTVTYNNHPVTVNSWNGTTINVTWPDIPFNTTYSDSQMFTDYILTVRRADNATQSTRVTTGKPTADYYFPISSFDTTGSIFANDDLEQFDAYYCYFRVLTGSMVTITRDGLIQGVTQTGSNPDLTAKYNIFSTNSLSWIGESNVSVSG